MQDEGSGVVISFHSFLSNGFAHFNGILLQGLCSPCRWLRTSLSQDHATGMCLRGAYRSHGLDFTFFASAVTGERRGGFWGHKATGMLFRMQTLQ